MQTTQAIDPRYWMIHGDLYDLRGFAAQHPGGEYILLLGQGRDCTELFESVHVMSDPHKIRALMKKYKVDGQGETDSDHFLWEDDGFYRTLSARVRERFKGRTYKASALVYCKLFVFFVAYLMCWYQAVRSGNIIWAAMSGVFTEMIGFCMMHGASHNAFSRIPLLNYLGLLWSPWMMWNHWTWLQHHVYGHHSYTGMYGKDPDIHNLGLILRKHFDAKQRPTTRFQHLYTWALLILLPGQHLGQIILYPLLPIFTKQIFITPVIRSRSRIFFHSLVVMILSLTFHVFVPMLYQSLGTVLLLWITNITWMSISYFFNVLPNHDTESTLQNHPPSHAKVDWGEQQVRCTANHSTNNSWFGYIITQLWGGMNYQVEHHLFPTVNHVHYHEISKIVQETCKEFNITYVSHANWFESAISFTKFLHVMAKIPSLEKYASSLSK
mmetsp:Transcript_21735/g.27688  ORF Transcript_21735/g.27688 Transcript_21735/m.27688 type:complete len:439 (-) Transcript_21735:23-1339(-)